MFCKKPLMSQKIIEFNNILSNNTVSYIWIQNVYNDVPDEEFSKKSKALRLRSVAKP